MSEIGEDHTEAVYLIGYIKNDEPNKLFNPTELKESNSIYKWIGSRYLQENFINNTEKIPETIKYVIDSKAIGILWLQGIGKTNYGIVYGLKKVIKENYKIINFAPL